MTTPLYWITCGRQFYDENGDSVDFPYRQIGKGVFELVARTGPFYRRIFSAAEHRGDNMRVVRDNRDGTFSRVTITGMGALTGEFSDPASYAEFRFITRVKRHHPVVASIEHRVNVAHSFDPEKEFVMFNDEHAAALLVLEGIGIVDAGTNWKPCFRSGEML